METGFSIELPGWISDSVHKTAAVISSPEDKMRFVIELSRRNVREGTGGPFAAAVFERNTGRLISAGVNLVVSSGFSLAHAEIIALSLAQKSLSQYRLSNRRGFSYELYSSCQPCAMCLGAIPWSGVSHLVCAAQEEDARAAGFDEGHKPDNWEKGLLQRGIQVHLDVLRQEAAPVLTEYFKTNGKIY
jgi:tRNA(Arg) A34 adenosine deaminase TadA